MIRAALYLISLVLVFAIAFTLGRQSAQPSIVSSAAEMLGAGRWSGLVAGAFNDARTLIDGVRLDLCLKDTKTLAEANEELSERLGTSESRLEKALADRDAARLSVREHYETSKMLADRLYSRDCSEWASTPVCPGVSSLLRNEGERGGESGPSSAGGDSGKESTD